MTARDAYEGLLTELSKVNAPSILLQDFNYFLNKAINQYINKRYNIYDVNLQTTDDLRVLKSTAILEVKPVVDNSPFKELQKIGTFGATYEVILPQDYLHILNCLCLYKLNGNYKCYKDGDYALFAAKRLTADSWSIIVNDYYNRPLPERPYFYIHNVNINSSIPTNPITLDNPNGTDISAKYDVKIDLTDGDEGKTNFKRIINLAAPDSRTISTVNRDAGTRYGNASNVRMEIRYGTDDSIFKLEKVFVDYIKSPQTIRLTLELVNLIEDTSLILEFPDYVCQEIMNELVGLIMQNIADPRLQTNYTVTQSIGNPVQQLTT